MGWRILVFYPEQFIIYSGCEDIAIYHRYDVPKNCLYSLVLYLICRFGCLMATMIVTMVIYDGFDLRSDQTT